MKRPTISLAMIVKNEAENLPRLFESIQGCFDEVHLTDTGSTDGTQELGKKLGAQVHSFEWINDFSAARNASFKPITTDYVMWLDADDILENKEAFIQWRDHAMGLAEYWLATYHYASEKNTDKPICSFARERVFKTDRQMQWRYFVHEGVLPQSHFGQIRVQYIPTWAVRHRRTEKDIEKDRFRNLKIFESRKDMLDVRMKYYYGKELFEANQPVEASQYLLGAAADPTLENHDRILALQYATYSYMSCNQWDKAMQIALQGVQLSPHRAEYYVSIGDCYLKQSRLADAIPSYTAAKHCINQNGGNGFAGAIFTHKDAYTTYPRNQLARIYANLGNFDLAEKELKECIDLQVATEETHLLLREVQRVKSISYGYQDAKPCDDIVITCPGQGLYEWDGEIAKTRGIGGSETAAVQMAQHLAKLSGRPVKIFNSRTQDKIIEGVEYISNQKIQDYFSKHQPWAHLAWRHNIKLTNARTFFWCHDLMAFGGENTGPYEKLLCLTPFHKDYVMAMQGIPAEKIEITRNGIDPMRFLGPKPMKNPNKIIFPSSPDRGLDRCMRILDEVRKEFPDLELHVFYGFDNMRKSGPQMVQMADQLEAMMKERPWVKYHGNTQQTALAKHFQEAVLWVHPANFIETFCITAIEALCSGTYPVTRKLGALQDTLKVASEKGMATVLDLDCEKQSEYQVWVEAVKEALRTRAWEKVKVDPKQYSWESVALEWLHTFLKEETPKLTRQEQTLEEAYGYPV